MPVDAPRGLRRRRGGDGAASAENDLAPGPARVRSGEDLRGHTERQPSGWTVRTVTPDSIPEVGGLSSLPTSPFGDQARESPGYGASRHQRLRSGSGNERPQGSGGEHGASRPRTRTIEERGARDNSPSALLMQTRQRLGSSASLNSTPYNGVDDAVTSIGHPSVVPGPLFNDSLYRRDSERRHIAKQAALGPDPLATPSSSNRQADPPSQPVLFADTDKILQLTKSLRGRMEGPLVFRRGDSTPWASAYCTINDEVGSLVYETRTSESTFRTLIPDLRGCATRRAFDPDSQMPYLDIRPQNSTLRIHLRPHTQDEFENWFAALLCWRPIRPKGIQNRMTKPQAGGMAGGTGPERSRAAPESRRHSEVSLLKEAPIIKVGKMIFWDTNVSYSYAGTPKTQASQGQGKASAQRMQSFGSRRWKRVSCQLRESGEFKLYTETDLQLVSCVQLSQLSRCAIQRLDASVLDNEWSIAIYPQYSASSTPSPLLRPVILSLESRVLFEVWLVLLRAFTIPLLYGPKVGIAPTPSPNGSRSSRAGTPVPPKGSSTADMFRMERSLGVRVMGARLQPEIPLSPVLPGQQQQQQQQHQGVHHHQRQDSVANASAFFAEVLLDGETRAKTMVKNDGLNPFWREEFDFQDLPPVVSVASIILKKRAQTGNRPNEKETQREMKRMYNTLSRSDGGSPQAAISFDQMYGKVDIYLDDLLPGKEVEKWWPVTNMYGQGVGEVMVRVKANEYVILMARDYQPMSELLHRFSNGLTLQLSAVLSSELKRLSECLLNIFQVSGSAGDWLMSLVEDEIDGTLKEQSLNRLRYNKRAGSNESGEATGSVVDRELIVRDMGKTASLEANLLFRGNTLLTKSLDLHMKRLGKEYLEETFGDRLREIADRDLDCEVDPNRIANANDLDRNWRRLIASTQDCWRCIAQSATRCPAELRYIFRHVRACAEDRYGDFLRTVSYSSVSGFLFLRFFCPAILNPKLFGLLRDDPRPNARRTFTLIAKAIQTLANMGTFGAKEQWMEPMNAFLGSHRQDFKTFLDNICSISSTTVPATPIPPSYSTPLQILQRLPPTSREGFPSLPYLIDHARNFAGLVNLWLDHCDPRADSIQEGDGDLLPFHQLCLRLRQRTEDCLARAERAERPSSVLSTRWDEMVEQLTSEYSQQQQQMDLAMTQARQQLPMTNGMRSRPESPIVRTGERKLSLQVPPTFEDRTHIARLQAAQPQHPHDPRSPVSANTTASASQYPSSTNEQSHDEDAMADNDATKPLRSTSAATEDAPSSNSEDDKAFFRGKLSPFNATSSGYNLGSGFAAARASTAAVQNRERERKERRRAELTRDLQRSLAQPMHSSGGGAVFGPFGAEWISSRSSPDRRMGSSRGETGLEAGKSNSEEAERQRERSGTDPRRKGEGSGTTANSSKQRSMEERPSLEEDVGKVSSERAPSRPDSGSGGSGNGGGKKKLQRGESVVGSIRAARHQKQAARKTSEESRVNAPPSSSASNASSSHITTAMAVPTVPSAASRGPSRQGHHAANNADKSSMLTAGSSATSSDTEASASVKVTALPRMASSASAHTLQRQSKTRVDREREAMIAEQLREGRNTASEMSLVDRLLAGGRKKKS